MAHCHNTADVSSLTISVAFVSPCGEHLSRPSAVFVLALDSHSANLPTFNQSASWLMECFSPHLKKQALPSAVCLLYFTFLWTVPLTCIHTCAHTYSHTSFFLSLLAWYSHVVFGADHSLAGSVPSLSPPCWNADTDLKTALVGVQEAFLCFSH